ncbi:MAG: prepilin-type N-terminal cleavage/methylation domain-containing protein [Candidatus Brocadiia bacterium]
MRTDTKGFTLIEILLALALASIVITVCYAILIGTLKAQTEADEAMRWSRIQAAVFDALSDDITQATKPRFMRSPESYQTTTTDPAATPTPTPTPSPDTATGQPAIPRYFIAELNPDWSDGAGIAFVVARPSFDAETQQYYLYRSISYFIKRDDRTRANLLYRREKIGYEGTIEEGGGAEILCDIISTFEINYFDGKEWLEEWKVEEKGDLPSAVRIKIGFYFDRLPDGTPDVSKPAEEFFSIFNIRGSHYINPEDQDRMMREGLIETPGPPQ